MEATTFHKTTVCISVSVIIANSGQALEGPYLTGLHDSDVPSSHQPLHPCTHRNAPTASSEHQHLVMLCGGGPAARVKIRDGPGGGVALPQTTQCSHSVCVCTTFTKSSGLEDKSVNLFETETVNKLYYFLTHCNLIHHQS